MKIPFVLDRHLLECAYRKAKTELFYDRSASITDEVIAYQEKLDENLTEVQNAFVNGDFASFFIKHPIQTGFIAKKLNPPKEATNSNHIFHSSLDKSGQLKNIIDGSTAEFRKIAVFPFEIHVLSAYWVITIGSKFDSALSKHAYASRLNRLKNGEIHKTKLSLFKPYFFDYDNWRRSSLSAVEHALKNDETIGVMTFDFSAYYHNIDPLFLLETEFHERIGIRLTSREIKFTKAFLNYIRSWDPSEKIIKSLPIGLTMSSLIANVFLADFDHEIERELSPVYYGRYMDDLILAVRTTPGKIVEQQDFISLIGEKVSYFNGVKQTAKGDYTLQSPLWALKSKLKFNSKKQKLFVLYGKSGLDLIDNIATTIDEISSERRLLPNVDSLTRSKAAMILATNDGREGYTDSLRKADGLTMKRFGWSVLLRSAQLLGATLQPEVWQNERFQFYKFAKQHVLNPISILDNTVQIPRLLSVFVTNRDWIITNKVLNDIRDSLSQLESASINVNGIDQKQPDGIIDSFRISFIKKVFDGIVRSVDIKEMEELDYKVLSKILGNLKHGLPDYSPDYLKRYVLEIHMIDFGLNPVNEPGIYQIGADIDWANTHIGNFGFDNSISQFLTFARNSFSVLYSDTIVPLDLVNRDFLTKAIAYPTRPLKPSQIFNIIQDTTREEDFGSISFSVFRTIVAAIRGSWLPNLDSETSECNNSLLKKNLTDPSKPPSIVIGVQDEQNKNPIRTIGLTHLHTSDKEWYATAANKSSLTLDRYNRIADVINQALKAKTRPDYLLLPELAIPKSVINAIASRLEPENINLILGAEYTHFTDKKTKVKKIFSTAELFLFDKRLGYKGYLHVTQRKGLPAPHEEHGLVSLHSLVWDEDKSAKPIYRHNGFHFGLLICSELQNVQYRKSFQGNVDTVFVLSWNKDLETFNALIEASALDIHAYIAFVNNRKYGDSRLRVPFKTDYMRDVFRVKGGENEMLGVIKIDFEKLRRFQTKAKRWSYSSDLFKPVPEDFVIDETRKMTPP